MVKVKTKNNQQQINKKIEKELKKGGKSRTEAEETIRRFIIIFVVVLVLLIGIYFLTKVLLDNRSTANNNSTINGEVNYDVTTIGMILNRPYDEYYVMIYNSEDAKAIYYSSLITNYQQKEDGLKVYYCDLANSLNSEYKANNNQTNPSAKKIEELSLGEVTLLKIKDGKIDKYIENIDSIKSALQ